MASLHTIKTNSGERLDGDFCEDKIALIRRKK
jgi:hypothetical protein